MNKLTCSFFVLVLLVSCAHGQEPEEDTIEDFDLSSNKPIKLNKDNFISTISEPESGTLVMFYAPWCGHCKRMVSTWNQLAKKHNPLKKFILAKVDCTDQTELCSDNDILAYPTFLFFKRGSIEGVSYDGHRNLESIESFMLDQLNQKPILKDESLNEIAVNELDENNFKDFIAKGFHFIKFFAPWCGHCQMMAPTWEELGKKYLNTPVKISKVDCTKYGIICTSNEVRGYPTLLFFHNGKMIQSYNKQRTLEAFSKFIDDIVQSFEKKTVQEEQVQVEDNADADADDIKGEVIGLTIQNFRRFLNKKGFLFVKFYAPWCGHCQAMVQAWNDLAFKLRDNSKVRITEVDCTNNAEICMNQNINHYPTLILYKSGSKIADYTGVREVEAFEEFLNNYLHHDDL